MVLVVWGGLWVYGVGGCDVQGTGFFQGDTGCHVLVCCACTGWRKTALRAFSGFARAK